MAFTAIKSESKGLMEEGEYEVTCKSCLENVTKGGFHVIDFDFVVRKDVEQKYGGKHIFKTFYKDDKTGQWPVEKIGKYAWAMGKKDGAEFELSELAGAQCVAVIRHWTNKETGDVKETIYYLKETQHPTEVNTTEAESEQEEDLPF